MDAPLAGGPPIFQDRAHLPNHFLASKVDHLSTSRGTAVSLTMVASCRNAQGDEEQRGETVRFTPGAGRHWLRFHNSFVFLQRTHSGTYTVIAEDLAILRITTRAFSNQIAQIPAIPTKVSAERIV